MHNNQASILTGIIKALYADNTALVSYEFSQITGETTNPIKPENPRELETKATINRTFVTANSLLYRQMDPMAVYTVGDRIALYEHWAIDKFTFHIIGAWRVLEPPTAGPTVNI